MFKERRLKKKFYSPIDNFLKKSIYFVFFIFLIFLSFSSLLANDNSLKLVNTVGRSVIIDNNIELAKKKALEEALYLASLQGGARVDGFSSIDNQTNLNENLLVRPASQIIDFTIIEEFSDKTHFSIKIQAALLFEENNINCQHRNKIKLSYLKPYFIVSSKLPAWTNSLPKLISEEIFKNISNYEDIEVIDLKNSVVEVENVKNNNNNLSYNSIMGKNVTIKNGEFSIIPYINLKSAESRLHRFSKEILFSVNLKIFEGPDFKNIENIKYEFSLSTILIFKPEFL